MSTTTFLHHPWWRNPFLHHSMRNLEAPLEFHQSILSIALVEPQASGLPFTEATVACHKRIVPTQGT